MPSPESEPQLSLAVGTRLYVKKDGQIMPRDANPIIRRIEGIPFIQGSTVEILEIKNDAARIQVYTDNGHKLGDINRWYDLDKFSTDLFSIDHRKRNTETREPMSEERASELMEEEGEIRSTDGPGDVAKTFRAAYEKLSGSDKTSN